MKRSTYAVALVAMCTAIGVAAVSKDTPTAWVVAQGSGGCAFGSGCTDRRQIRRLTILAFTPARRF